MIEQIKFLLEQEAERVYAKQLKCGESADQNGVEECQAKLKRISLLKQTADNPEHLKVRSEN